MNRRTIFIRLLPSSSRSTNSDTLDLAIDDLLDPCLRERHYLFLE